jgi:hypothetical protein
VPHHHDKRMIKFFILHHSSHSQRDSETKFNACNNEHHNYVKGPISRLKNRKSP